MVRRGSRNGRWATWALALALALVPSATCLTAAEMTEAQKACCAAMNHDCDGMSVEQDCCVATAPNPLGVSASVSAGSHLAFPPLVVVNTIAEPEPERSDFESSVFDVGAPKYSSRPTYLIVSVFRL
jgi:hypothetical protein